MTTQPDRPDAAEIVETLEHCHEDNLDLVVVHDADGSHLGYALNVLRARADGDDAFADQIMTLAGEQEMLRSALELAESTVSGLVVADCEDPDCDQHDQPETADAGCADPYAVFGYLTAMSHLLADDPDQSDLALLCEDLAEATLDGPAAQTSDLLIHRVSTDRALALCSRLVATVERRYGVGLDEQAEQFQRCLVAGK